MKEPVLWLKYEILSSWSTDFYFKHSGLRGIHPSSIKMEKRYNKEKCNNLLHMFVLRNPDVIILLKMYKFSFTQALHTVA